MGEVKKSSVELKDRTYSFYNDEGKRPIVPLIHLSFDEFSDAINNMPNSFYKLNQNPVKVNPNVNLKNDVQWFSTINGKPLTMIELALHATSYYEVVSHIYEE